MSDEFTQRRLAKYAAEHADTQVRAVLNQRAAELRRHNVAIVQYVHAVAMAMERSWGEWPDTLNLVRGIATGLGINDEHSLQIMERIFEQEATGN